MTRKVVMAIVAFLLIVAAIITALIYNMSKPPDEVVTGPGSAKHILTKELEEYGLSVSDDIKERAENIDKDSFQNLYDTLGEIGFSGQKQQNLAEVCALMRLSYGQIVLKPMEKMEADMDDVYTDNFHVRIKGKDHMLRVMFDIDKNKTIQSITDENWNQLYGITESGVLDAEDINVYYAPSSENSENQE